MLQLSSFELDFSLGHRMLADNESSSEKAEMLPIGPDAIPVPIPARIHHISLGVSWGDPPLPFLVLLPGTFLGPPTEISQRGEEGRR